MASNILRYFPEEMNPRQVQRDLLLELEREWEKSDIFVITAPTAAGKTAIASTIMRWSAFAAYVVPNNQLLDQASTAVPLAPAVRKRSTYWCSRNRMSCEDVHKRDGKCCGDSCTYERALANATTRQMSISNYHTYLAHRLYKSTLIVDEAHLLVDMLQDLAARKIWRSQYNWPKDTRTLGDLVAWLDDKKAQGMTLDAKLSKLYKELTTLQPSTLVIRTMESLRNSPPQDVLKLIPLDTKNEPPVLWPPHRVKKIVLLSATIGLPDVENMGLHKRRVCYLNCASPIPVANRPIIYEPVGSMSHGKQDATLPALCGAIEYKLERHREKGLIHATYKVAAKLFDEIGNNPRLMFHDQTNKAEVYSKWVQSDPAEGRVLVACGMYEGIDVAYEAGTWQIVTKIPFPSLVDPAIRAKLREDPTWYAWASIKPLVQASGRICRAPDDRGITYILDSSFARLLKEDNERDIPLIPKFFREALV